MINAHIEMDLNQHIAIVSARVIELMKNEEVLILESLMRKFLKKYEEYTPEQFMHAISLLFAMDNLEVNEYKVRLKYV